MNIRWLYPHRALVAVLVAAALSVGLMTVLVIRQQQDQSSGQVYLEAGASVGSNPFIPLMPSYATEGENLVGTGGGASFQEVASTDDQHVCNTEKIISHLAADSRAGEAWVRALNFDRTLVWSGGSRIEAQQISAYIHELRPRVLSEDLRVTNYQFVNGAAIPVQSVLQEGTAILVDTKGVARVRCASGNPLSPMIQSKAPTVYRGAPWPSFHPQRVVVTQHAPQCGRDESYDGQRCRPTSVCPNNEYSGDDGQCDGRDNDEQRWLRKPGRPDEPLRPAEHPDEQERPGRLSQPDEPARADEPRRPDRPGRPEEPAHPDRPAHPVRSPHEDNSTPRDKPEKPEKPERPDDADQPRKSPQGHRIPPSKTPEPPAKGDQPERSQRPEKPAPPRTGEHPDKSRRSHKPVKPGESEHPDRPKRPNRPDKPEKSTQPDRSEKSENVKRSERSKRETARQIERA